MTVSGRWTQVTRNASFLCVTIGLWLLCGLATAQQQSLRAKPFQPLMDKYSITVKNLSYQNVDLPPTSMVEEAIFGQSYDGVWRIEKSRFNFKKSKEHPVWVEVFLASSNSIRLLRQNFRFEENHPIRQVARIRRFDDPTLNAYRSTTPFYGKYTPVASTYSELLELISKKSDGRIKTDAGRYVVRGKIDEIGEFEISYDSIQSVFPTQFKRILLQGDKISSTKSLGVVKGQKASPRAIYKEVDDWHDIQYETVNGEQRIVSATQHITSYRSDDSIDHYLRKSTFHYSPARQPRDRFEWDSAFLEVRNGAPVELVPADHRRFEYIDGRVVLVIDKKAVESIGDTTFSSQPKSTGKWTFLISVLVVLLSVGLVTWRLMRGSNA